MWPAISDMGAALATALAVKLMDDALDAGLDAAAGWRTRAGELGVAAMPYALLCLATAALLNPDLAAGLFLACYAVGMAAHPGALMPTGAPAWAESVLAVGLSALLLGARETAASLLVVACVQLADDWLDNDSRLGRELGRHALLLGAGAAAFAAAWLDWQRLITVCTAAGLVGSAVRRKRRWQR